MFGKEDKFRILQLARPVIAVINCYTECNLFQKYLEGGKEYKYSFYGSLSHLNEQYIEYQHFSSNEKGLINIKWNLNILPKLPSVIICLYPISDSYTKESKTIISDLETIKKRDPHVKIVFLIKFQKHNKMLLERRDVIARFNKVTEKYNIWLVNDFDKESLPDLKQCMASIENLSIQYYDNYCKGLNSTIKKATEVEEKLRNTIQIGIIQFITAKKVTDNLTKPLIEAYNGLLKLKENLNLNNEDNILKFWEYRAVADWLIIKILEIKTQTESAIEIIERFSKHLDNFFLSSKFSQKKPTYTMHQLYDYYWIYKRIDSLINLLDTNKTKEIQNLHLEWLLKRFFNFIRFIKIFHSNFKDIHTKTSVMIDDKEIALSQVTTQLHDIYGKPPSYMINNDKIIGFNNEIYLIQFIQNEKINQDNLRNILKNELFPQICSCLENINSGESYCTKIYLSHLIIDIESIFDEETSVFFELKKIFSKLKFPKSLVHYGKIYFGIISRFNDMLIKNVNSSSNEENATFSLLNNKLRIIQNFLTLANYRSISQDEQTILLNYIKEVYTENNNKSTLSLQPFLLNVINGKYFKNKLFNFKYKISQPLDKHSFNLVQYDITIESEFDIDNIPINSIELIFSKAKRNKLFTCNNNSNEEYFLLSKNNPIKLIYQIILQDKEEIICLNQVNITLKYSNNAIFYIDIPKSSENEIKAEQPLKEILSITCDNKVTIGKNEYYYCKMELNRRDIPLLFIKNVKLIFQSFKSDDNDTIGDNGLSYNEKDLIVNHNILFYTKDENQKLIESKNIVFEIINFEEFWKTHMVNNNKLIFKFLVKHLYEGDYFLKYTLNYSLYSDENNNTNLISFSHCDAISFKVITPFISKFDFECPYICSYQNQNIQQYPINQPFQMKLSLNNPLKKNLFLKQIKIYLKYPTRCTITSSIQEMMDLIANNNDDIYASIKDSICVIREGSEFVIPFECVFKDSIENNNFGEVKIIWTTSALQEFSDDVFNENSFMFPKVKVDSFRYDLKCEVGNFIKEQRQLPINIYIENKKDEVKKILFSFESEETCFYVEGSVKRNIILYPKENKKLELMLIPTSFGNLKMPRVRVTELNLYSNDEKLLSVEYIPETVYIEI